MAVIGFIICLIVNLAVTFIAPFLCILAASFSGKSEERWWALVPFVIGCGLLYLTIAHSPFHITLS